MLKGSFSVKMFWLELKNCYLSLIVMPLLEQRCYGQKLPMHGGHMVNLNI